MSVMRRFGLWARVIAFVLVVLACGFASGIVQSMWTSAFPLTCASEKLDLFAVDFEAFPARIGEQDNACAGLGNGDCEGKQGDLAVVGQCRNGRMNGRFSVTNTKAPSTVWSGTYCDGLPCGEFRRRVDTEHEDVFHVENMHIHGATTLWEKSGDRLIEATGRYERGKRVGRWARRVEPSRALVSASIFDEQGFLTMTSFSCTNGYLKEVRGKDVTVFDAQGKSIAKGTLGDGGEAESAALCPLP